MADRPIIVIADSALFERGVSVGFGAVIGALLAVALDRYHLMLIPGGPGALDAGASHAFTSQRISLPMKGREPCVSLNHDFMSSKSLNPSILANWSMSMGSMFPVVTPSSRPRSP